MVEKGQAHERSTIYKNNMMPARVPSSIVKQKNKEIEKHEIVLLVVPTKFEIEGNLLGHVNNMKYVDHDVHDLSNLPKFAKEKYMEEMSQPEGFIWYEE